MKRRDFLAASAVAALASLVPRRSAAEVRLEPADILVAGDSWATLSADAVAHVSKERVLDVSLGGTTARQWCEKDPLVGDLTEMARVTEAHTVYLSMGALDHAVENPGSRRIVRRIASVVTPLVDRGVRVVHAGYNKPWHPPFQKLLGEIDHDEALYHFVEHRANKLGS